MLDQLPRVSFPASARLGAKIHEVVGVIVAVTHNIVLGVVKEREELVVETSFAFRGELVPEAPHAGAEDGPEVVHVLSWGHPVRLCVS